MAIRTKMTFCQRCLCPASVFETGPMLKDLTKTTNAMHPKRQGGPKGKVPGTRVVPFSQVKAIGFHGNIDGEDQPESRTVEIQAHHRVPCNLFYDLSAVEPKGCLDPLSCTGSLIGSDLMRTPQAS